jgi:transposase
MPRRKFTPEFKARVVLDMLVNNKTLSQTSREYGIQGSVLSRWRKEFLQRAPQLFEQPAKHSQSEQRIAELERLAGLLAQQLAAAKEILGTGTAAFCAVPRPIPPLSRGARGDSLIHGSSPHAPAAWNSFCQ